MSEWSEDAAQRSRERQLVKRIRDAKALQDNGVLNNQKGRALWSELRSLIARMCEEFNAEPGNIGMLSLVSSQTGFTLSCTHHPAMITGTFSGDTIHFSGKNGIRYEAQLHVRLTVGLDAWLSDSRGRPANLAALSNDVIEIVLHANGHWKRASPTRGCAPTAEKPNVVTILPFGTGSPNSSSAPN